MRIASNMRRSGLIWGSDGKAKYKINVLFPKAVESQELMKRSDCVIGSKRGFKVEDPGVSQVWTVSKDTEALCVNPAGKLAPYQARPDTGGEAGR